MNIPKIPKLDELSHLIHAYSLHPSKVLKRIMEETHDPFVVQLTISLYIRLLKHKLQFDLQFLLGKLSHCKFSRYNQLYPNPNISIFPPIYRSLSSIHPNQNCYPITIILSFQNDIPAASIRPFPSDPLPHHSNLRVLQQVQLRQLFQAPLNSGMQGLRPHGELLPHLQHALTTLFSPQNYAIDPKTVRDMAKDLQKEFHPDKFNQVDSQSLQMKMAKYSTYINQAKATLLNDLQRAIYLMQLKGMNVKEEIDTTDSEFMKDIFEINESIEDAGLKEAEEIKMRLEGILKDLQKDLQDFFQSDDLTKCREFVVKYKYLHSSLVNVKQRISNLMEKRAS